MNHAQYWVVGGEFGSLNFHTLLPGTQQVHGPYPTRPDAEYAWRQLSETHRHQCSVRFTIVRDVPRAEAAAAASARGASRTIVNRTLHWWRFVADS